MYLIINYKNKKSEYLPEMRMIIDPEKLTVGPSDYIFKSTIEAIISNNFDLIRTLAIRWVSDIKSLKPYQVTDTNIISYLLEIEPNYPPIKKPNVITP